MTFRQQLLKVVYPLLVLYKNAGKQQKMLKNPGLQQAVQSLYSLSATSNTGKEISFHQYRGKKLLLVNTASECGYTPQYKELEELYQRRKGAVVIIAFPSNDFHEQEPGNDANIENFCRVNYGITFPIISKSVVTGHNQNPVFEWLTRKDLNGWNDKLPPWNFTKYLVNESGILTHVFFPHVSPLDKQVLEAIDE
jgi:glutathione peroxidase